MRHILIELVYSFNSFIYEMQNFDTSNWEEVKRALSRKRYKLFAKLL